MDDKKLSILKLAIATSSLIMFSLAGWFYYAPPKDIPQFISYIFALFGVFDLTLALNENLLKLLFRFDKNQ